MKVCELCGVEIDTKDGENRCRKCDGKHSRKGAKRQRHEIDSVMRDLGMTKVRGTLGGTYWE